MSTYSSYADNFFGHSNQQSGHLATQHNQMIFHPSPTYYASGAQDLVYPQAQDLTAMAFSFYQPTQRQWPDTQKFDVNYPANPFDYCGSSHNNSSTMHNIKNWSSEPYEANAQLLPPFTDTSNSEMLMTFQQQVLVTTTSGSRTNATKTTNTADGECNNNHSFLPPLNVVDNLKGDQTRPPRSANGRLFKTPNASPKVFSCTMCNRQYCRKSTLKAHCCNKTFTQAANLTAHMRVHSGEKPFACSICLRSFSQSSSLVTHQRTHTGERPYHCPHCVKSFTDSSTLTKHMRIHSGYKPYSCDLCLMRFSQSGNLNRHMKTHREL